MAAIVTETKNLEEKLQSLEGAKEKQEAHLASMANQFQALQTNMNELQITLKNVIYHVRSLNQELAEVLKNNPQLVKEFANCKSCHGKMHKAQKKCPKCGALHT